jgi:hypothetical protein
MAGRRRAIELAIGEEDLAALRATTRSRAEPASRGERARMLLAYREDPSFFRSGERWGRAILAPSSPAFSPGEKLGRSGTHASVCSCVSPAAPVRRAVSIPLQLLRGELYAGIGIPTMLTRSEFQVRAACRNRG